MTQKLFITRPLPQAVLEKARAHFDVTLDETGTALTPQSANQRLREYDVILPTLGDGLAATAFEGGPFRCKGLANFGVGYNHIDAEAAKSAGLIVTNTPGAVTDATADIAMTLILSTCRRAGEGERAVRAGTWSGWAPTQFLGTHVTGKKVGIIGMGRIGKAIAKRCHFGFDMDVVFFNRSTVAEPGVPARQIDTVHALLDEVDIAVIAVPATPQTRHMINESALRALGEKGILINIARGDIVDEPALVEALKAGTIAGAGLDVYENEPALSPGLSDCENAVLLPHLGTAALEVREAMGFMALDNAIAMAEGREVPNPV